MLTMNEIKFRISNLEHMMVPQDMFTTTIHHGRIDSLYWTISNGELKSETEIRNRIKRIEEELLVLSPNLQQGDTLWYDEKSARIEELRGVLYGKSN